MGRETQSKKQIKRKRASTSKKLRLRKHDHLAIDQQTCGSYRQAFADSDFIQDLHPGHYFLARCDQTHQSTLSHKHTSVQTIQLLLNFGELLL
mmetsp:Transcript_83172/g.131255  ORF Transcript_83172/g.131255 Transcript_83172/m.131255 type:complete len:93 (+) Transcript_83172:146-424(+)